jgi:hypothetical protein
LILGTNSGSEELRFWKTLRCSLTCFPNASV